MVAPLDWGLGHATRCIPVIKCLLKHGAEVVLAADGAMATVLQLEFPGLPLLKLKGYHITYSKTKGTLFSRLLLQSPKIIGVIEYEKKWIKKIVREYEIDAVISDNRFGLHHKKIPSVYITHQLHIHTGNIVLSTLAQRIHYKYINHFNRCWVPDYESDGLAGKLSHPEMMPAIPVQYLGPLSRLKKQKKEKNYDVFISLSGPEPQRSLLEKVLLPQLRKTKKKIILVRGLPLETKKLFLLNDDVTVFNHLPAEEFGHYMCQSKICISRAGYSSIMDYVSLQQEAILIPTPGQTEQEYLAQYLEDKKIFSQASPHKFSIEAALSRQAEQNFKAPARPVKILDDVVKAFIKELKESIKK